MPRHEDVAKLVLVYRQWFPKLEIGIMKFDVARAFRQRGEYIYYSQGARLMFTK